MLYAILMGLDSVDSSSYPVKSPLFQADVTKLNGSAGATALENMLVEFYGATPFVTKPCSADVIARFQQLAQTVKAGDVLVCAYAGHGVFIETTNADAIGFAKTGLGKLANGTRRWTTAMVLEDRLMLADEYSQLLAAFGSDITIFNIVESCVSAGMLNAATPYSTLTATSRVEASAVDTISSTSDALSTMLYDLDKKYYDCVLAKGPGLLNVAGIHFASATADKCSKAGVAGSPFSQAIADAIRYNDLPSYRALDTKVKAEDAGLKEFTPVMFPFGRAGKTLLETEIVAPHPRLKQPETVGS